MNASMLKYIPLLSCALSLSACAQPNAPAPTGQAAPATAAARVTTALKKLDPNVKPEHIQPAPVAGFQQVIVGGQVLYVSNDGKYLMQGTLYDIDNKRDAGAAALADLRRKVLEEIPVKDRIVFSPENPKHTVTVFTDVECGYCRKMHSEIEEYMKQGIAVQYVAFPRMGPASEDFRKMEAVWCSNDRKRALTLAKLDKPVVSKACTNPVAMQYRAGQRVGLEGTPMVLAADGTLVGGYVPPAQMRQVLDKLGVN